MNNTNCIHEYIYDKRRQLKGVWVASPTITNPAMVNIGWSLCNTKLGDRFDKRRAFEIALGRAVKLSAAPIPASLEDGYKFFANRCKRYYKDKAIITDYNGVSFE
jgi:hypothetical protein